MEKLKSCPFCGSKAEFKYEPIRIKGTWCDAVYVHCKGCGARTNHVLYDAKLHSNGSEYQQVAAAWNRRAALENDYAALKARCDEINRYNISCTKKIDELLAEKISAPGNKPLTLEQLRQMNGEPVWIVFLLEPEKSEWKLIDGHTEKCTLFRSDYSLYNDGYGKTWLAYARKPERSENK